MLGIPNDLYDVHDPVAQAAVNLFYGLGYNFYRVENQLRADDLLVRHQIAETIGDVRKALSDAEGQYRRDNLPPLTRENPRSDPEALKVARRLEALVASVAATAARIRGLPSPGTDRITQRHRQEADTLRKLLLADLALGGHAELLKKGVLFETVDAIIERENEIRGHLMAIEKALGERKAILSL